jgi:exodeoxyribonuclease VII small subunit
MARKLTTDPSPVADFEASLDQLEQLVDKMEHGELTLEESLAAYERGVGLYRRCQTALEQAELRVRLLSDPANVDSAEAFPAGASPLGNASTDPDA